jgi:Methyltransferase domain
MAMKHLFYQEWTNKRVNRIVDIFGKSWFNDKTVLELGAAHGDIGIELLKLGADVTFSDVRPEHLDSIGDNLKNFNFMPKCQIINQNKPYEMGKNFDLVLHLGVLYHIENWKQDLECALNHTNTMILESAVSPSPELKHPIYGPYNCKNPVLTQEGIEEHLTDLGCKFIRYDISELDCFGGWILPDMKDNHFYSWNENWIPAKKTGPKDTNHYRRFWLVLR